MNHMEFGTQIDRLRSVYGEKAYPAERNKVLFRSVQEFSSAWFEKLVDELIASETYAPLLPKFREAIASEREKAWNKQKSGPTPSWTPNPNCTYCRDNGVYVCTQNVNGNLYAFRCHCEKGMQNARTGIPQLKQAHAKEFTWCDIVKRKQEIGVA